jgi:hypothetical protein
MKTYLRSSIRSFYLFMCWPTQLSRESVDSGVGGRAHVSGMLWPMIILLIIEYFLDSYFHTLTDSLFEWVPYWLNVGLRILSGLAIIPVLAIFTVMAADTDRADGLIITFVLVAVSILISSWQISSIYDLITGVSSGILMTIALILTSFAIGKSSNPSNAMIVVLLVTFCTPFVILFTLLDSTSFGIVFWMSYFRLATYPFDVILATLSFMWASQSPAAAFRAWRWCPVAWNELAWLPLPFVGRLLALLVRQDREEGFRQIAFVAAERPFQSRAAREALLEVAISDLTARSIARVADVADRLGWMRDTTTTLPAEMTIALPRFERVAEQVGQCLLLHSRYRKQNSLKQAVAEVDVLQKGLVSASGRTAQRLLRVANQWRVLIETDLATLQIEAEVSREIANPFVFGAPVRETEHNVFSGRRDIVQQIEASILGTVQAPTLLLYGPRRMGKTSVLNQLSRLLGPDFAPAIVDCQNPAVTGSPSTLLRHLSRALSASLQRRRVTVDPLTPADLEREPFDAFDGWLDRVEQDTPASMRALLCLDEYERLQTAVDAGWGTQFLDAVRHTLQHRPRIVLLFSGAHTFAELGPAWTDRFISARRVRVSFLRREDVEVLLTRPIPEFDLTYADGALDAIWTTAAGQPFLTQAVAFELVQLVNEQQRRVATVEDVKEAISRALSSGGEYFANLWSDAGEQGQAILTAVATGAEPPSYSSARTWLREHDVLTDDDRFAVPMVERWVREHAARSSHGETPPTRAG